MDCLTFLLNKTVALGSSSTGGVRTVQGGLRIKYCTTTSERGNGINIIKRNSGNMNRRTKERCGPLSPKIMPKK